MTAAAIKKPVDGMLLAAVVALVGTGLVMVYSSSAVFALRTHGSSTYLLEAQAARVALGVLAFWSASRVPRDLLQRYAPWILLGACVLCVAVLIPGIGHAAGGARRWLRLGPLTLQPSELAKIAVVISLSAALAKREAAPAGERRLLPPLLLAQLPVFLIILEPDFGTALVTEALALTLVFVAGLRLRYVFALGLAGLPVIYTMLMEGYRLKRIIAWLNPIEHRSTIGYQLTEALISIGTGGPLGVGLGESRQKLFFLPEAHTDFVFAIFAEELGFVGVLGLLAAFLLLVHRGARAALSAGSAFDRYLAVGIVALIAIPAVFNLWVVTGLLPTKGLPLPLISYGGSNVVSTLGALGLLAGISRHAAAGSDA